MASKKRIVLQVLAYTLYGLGVFLVILYVTFPYDLVWQRLVDEFSQDDLQLSVTHIRPGFPLGVSLRNVRLRLDSLPPPGTVLQLQTLRLQPAWLPLLSRTLQINLDAALYNGRLRGAIHPPLPNTTAWTLQGRFAGLRLERHPLLQKEGEPFLRGRLDGGLDLTISQNGQIQPGTVSLRLRPVVFVASQLLRLPSQRDVTCDTLESQLRITARQVQITSFACNGDDLTITAHGVVQWRQPLTASILNLQVQMRSEASYKQELSLIGVLVRRPPDRHGALSFTIRGTLQQPRFGA